MTWKRWAGIAVLAFALIAVWWAVFRDEARPPAVALVDMLAEAEKRPTPDGFSVKNVTIGEETRRAISVPPASRMIFRVVVPNDAWLKTAVAIEPQGWQQEGDGVLFRIGVSDGRTYDPLLHQHVNPYSVPADRRWVPVTIDLSAYGGRSVQIIFNTNTSLPQQGDDPRGDLPLWAEPAIYLK
ncbi:MAG: hypothetical protein ACE148_14165 [Vicinamibacterales bacterium]